MGESEELTQREELKNWLGRLSYILHRSDELHENLNSIRGQYRYADYWQIWKLPQFFAHTVRCASWVFMVFIVVLFVEVAKGSLLAAMYMIVAIGPCTIGLYFGIHKLSRHAARRILVAKQDGSAKGVKDYARLKACEKEHFVSLTIVSNLVPLLLAWTLLGLLISFPSKNPTTSMVITVLLFLLGNLVLGVLISAIMLVVHNAKVKRHNASEDAATNSREAHNEQVHEREKAVVDEINSLVGEYRDNYQGKFPAAYLLANAVAYMWQLVDNYRASTLQEVINVYEGDMHRQRIESQNRAMLNNQLRMLNNQERIIAEQRYTRWAVTSEIARNRRA